MFPLEQYKLGVKPPVCLCSALARIQAAFQTLEPDNSLKTALPACLKSPSTRFRSRLPSFPCASSAWRRYKLSRRNSSSDNSIEPEPLESTILKATAEVGGLLYFEHNRPITRQDIP